MIPSLHIIVHPIVKLITCASTTEKYDPPVNQRSGNAAVAVLVPHPCVLCDAAVIVVHLAWIPVRDGCSDQLFWFCLS